MADQGFIRHNKGAPTAAAFAAGQGSPIVLDTTNGNGYMITDAGSVVQFLTNPAVSATFTGSVSASGFGAGSLGVTSSGGLTVSAGTTSLGITYCTTALATPSLVLNNTDVTPYSYAIAVEQSGTPRGYWGADATYAFRALNGGGTTSLLTLDQSGNLTTLGSVTTTTAALGTNNTVVATTAFVQGSLTGRNKIINGDFQVDQHNFAAAVTPSGTGNIYVVDRWIAGISVGSKLTYQSTPITPANGIPSLYAIKITGPGTTYTPAAGDYFVLQQIIEGLNIRDLQLGTANAQPFTLSFYTYCTLAGTYSGAIRNGTVTESYPFSYTLAATTWTNVTVNVPAITSGTWVVTTAAGLSVDFCLAVGTTYAGTANTWSANNYLGVTGSTNFLGTASQNMFFTGVQLEKGSAATSFEQLQYQQTLSVCKRYYQLVGNGMAGYANGTATFEGMEKFEVEMRAAPAGALISGRSTYVRYAGGDNLASTPAMANFSASPQGMWAQISGFGSAFTSGQVLTSRNNGSTAPFIACSAEL